MWFYITVGVLWVFHMVLYLVCFIFKQCDDIQVDDDDVEEGQKQVKSKDQQQTQSSQQDGEKKNDLKCMNVSRFHFRNQRDNNLCCELVTNFIVIAIVVGAIFIFVGTSTEISQVKQNNNVQLYNGVNEIEGSKLFRAGICQPDMFGLSWLDYAYISRIAYQYSELGLSKMTKLFEDRGFTITVNSEIIHYAILHNESTKLTIVSFRGTASKLDGVHDAKVFIEAVIPNLAVPFFSIPFQTKEWIGRVFSYTGSRAWSAGPLSLVKNGDDVVKQLVKQYGADNVVVTGHSLGGGLATIIGTTNNLTNYGVSPPGSGIGKFMNKYSQEQVVRYSHALVPQRDPVAVLGSQQGNVVHIPCREPGSLACHSLDATICMLSSICGDRYLAESCAPYWNRWHNQPHDDSLSP